MQHRRNANRATDLLQPLARELLGCLGAQIASLPACCGGTPGRDHEHIVGDQLILHGNEHDLDLLEALIAVLEDSAEAKELRVVTVTETDGNNIARTVQDALQELSPPNRRPEDEVTVTALSSNVLLVSALPDEIDWVVGLIKQVDEVKPELPDLKQLVFPVLHRKASDVAEQLTEIVQKMREKQGATGTEGEMQIIANNANNSIMVLAEETEREKIARLLSQIDVEPVAGWGEVKLTLRLGQRLVHNEGGPCDEGYSYTEEVWEHEGRYVTICWAMEAKDCDGRLDRFGRYRTKVSSIPNDHHPEWEHEGSSQRDYAAEAAGY